MSDARCSMFDVRCSMLDVLVPARSRSARPATKSASRRRAEAALWRAAKGGGLAHSKSFAWFRAAERAPSSRTAAVFPPHSENGHGPRPVLERGIYSAWALAGPAAPDGFSHFLRCAT